MHGTGPSFYGNKRNLTEEGDVRVGMSFFFFDDDDGMIMKGSVK